MVPAIRTHRLTKTYGEVVGILDLDLEVDRGEVFGFLGPNGAGKTTTIRLLLDIVRPTRGQVRVLGLDPRADGVELRGRIGYLPGELALYGDLTGLQLFDWLAALRGGVDRGRLVQLIDRLDLDPTRPIRELSSGNRQKVGIVQAFMHDPELLVLDEPTRGLDPLVQQQFNGLVREARQAGRTVFLSSHVLDAVEAVAERVGIVRSGALAKVAAIDDLKAQAVRVVEISFAEPVDPERFRGLAGVRDVEIDGARARVVLEGDADAVVKAAAAFHVVAIRTQEPDLEDVFLAFYAEPKDSRAP